MQQVTRHTESVRETKPDFSRIKSRLERLTDGNLLVMLVVHRAEARQQIITLIDAPELDPTGVIKRATSLLNRLVEPSTWNELYDISNRNLDALASLVKLNLQCAHIYRELIDRLRLRSSKNSLVKRATRLRFEGKSDEEIFNDVLMNTRLGFGSKGHTLKYIQSYGRKVLHSQSRDAGWRNWDREDLQSVAKIAAWKYRQGEQAKITEKLGPLAISTRLPQDRAEVLEALQRSLLQRELEAWTRAFLPLLDDTWIRFPNSIRHTLQDHYEKRKAEKRKGIEVEYEDDPHREDYACQPAQGQPGQDAVNFVESSNAGQVPDVPDPSTTVAPEVESLTKEEEAARRIPMYEEQSGIETAMAVKDLLYLFEENLRIGQEVRTPRSTRPKVLTDGKIQKAQNLATIRDFDEAIQEILDYSRAHAQDRAIRQRLRNEAQRSYRHITIKAATWLALRRKLGGRLGFWKWLKDRARGFVISLESARDPSYHAIGTKVQNIAAQITKKWVAQEQEDMSQATLEDISDRVLRELEKRFGPKITEAFAARPHVKTNKEAAEKVGVSEQTYQNWVRESKKLYAKFRAEEGDS